MTTEISSDTAPVADASVDSASVDTAPIETAPTETPAPDTTIEAAPDAGADTITEPVLDAEGNPVAPAPAAFEPNFKYKAALEEKELDPFFHSLIKDADSEKKVKDVFTRADAFDFMKSKKEERDEQYESLSNDYLHVTDTVKNVEDALQRKDLTSVFRQLGVETNAVFQWAQQQIARMEMDPAQRQQLEQQEQVQLQNQNLEQQVSQLQTQYQQQATQARVVQLDVELSRPEIAQFAQKWDSHGGEGAFKQLVIEEAKKVFYDTKQDLSARQAVEYAMSRFGKLLNAGETVTQPLTAGASMQAQQAKPVIPNVTGKATSPIKKVPKSLDDLKKLAKEASMQG
jgi:transposase-like protein